MKKLVLTFLKFLLATICVYCFVIVGLYKTKSTLFSRTNLPQIERRRYGFTARKFEEIQSEKKLDILILGSSLATRNYDSRVFEESDYRSFNLGVSSQKPNMTNIIAEEYLEKINVKVLVIDVNPYLMLTPDSYETVNLIMNSPFTTYDLDLFESAPSIMAFNSLIIKYTGFAEKDRLKKIKDSISDINDRYVGRGFVNTNAIYDKNKKTPNIKIKDFNPLKNQIESLENLISSLKDKRIHYVLVLSPLNKTYFKTSKVSEKQFRSLSKTYFGKYGNYIDSNNLESYADSDFMDFSHLNATGAQKFTKALLPILKAEIKND
ncbi:hypothetical protein [Epilithonimonas sp.]|uniref:hypothetical protein n=1 Tax=Epilithonimonas sp. TaxID=2894511 RepID=UPI0028AF3500|nr:hypothetical protein [Epilithonimonas sp.]